MTSLTFHKVRWCCLFIFFTVWSSSAPREC